jgi:small subunit ribosomal protein S16
MAVKIRLMRLGSKRRPFYRFVVMDSRKKRDGDFLDQVGYYNPIAVPHEIKVDEEKVFEWLAKGAQISDGAHSLLKKIGTMKKWKTKGTPSKEAGIQPVSSKTTVAAAEAGAGKPAEVKTEAKAPQAEKPEEAKPEAKAEKPAEAKPEPGAEKPKAKEPEEAKAEKTGATKAENPEEARPEPEAEKPQAKEPEKPEAEQKATGDEEKKKD